MVLWGHGPLSEAIGGRVTNEDFWIRIVRECHNVTPKRDLSYGFASQCKLYLDSTRGRMQKTA